MRYVNPQVEYWQQTNRAAHVAKCARVCYASHQVPVAYLSMSIAKMSECDAVYFCAGWSKMRGCKIEHQIAQEYGLEILGLPE